MMLVELSERRFYFLLTSLCLFYLAVQFAYVIRLPLVMDEFAGMSMIMKHRDGIPYRDFTPYKTVLGYYLQLIPTYFSHDTWQQLINSKLFLAVINTVVIFWVASRLRLQMRAMAVLTATLLLVTMSTFLERSSDLRVDMLTSICGIAGLIWLLERRVLLAGIATGISVLVSQKGVYFGIAGTAALLVEWYFAQERNRAFRELCIFGFSATLLLMLYLLVFSMLAGAGTVFYQIFYRPASIAFDNLYDIHDFWNQTVRRNPVFWILSISSIAFFVFRNHSRTARILASYGGFLLVLGYWHRQPWPYFFVLLIPTCYVVLAALFDEFYSRKALLDSPLSKAAVVFIILAGILIPLQRLPVNLDRDNGFQRYMIEVSEELLEEDEVYLAGVPLLTQHRHISRPSSWLDNLQLSSLREQKDFGDIIEEIRNSKLKLIIGNYRITKLPPALKDYLNSQYMMLTGNIMIYAPLIAGQTSQVSLSFSGRYLVMETDEASVIVDGKTVIAGPLTLPAQHIYLDEGMHEFQANQPFRLQLQVQALPEAPRPGYTRQQSLFPNVYSY
jgi:hypothetical protein